MDELALEGGAILYYYQPVLGAGALGARSNLEVYFVYLMLDTPGDDYGLNVETRVRDTRLRAFYDGPVWLEEAYAWASAGPLTFEVGKLYSRLGLTWDNSFYGNILAFDGLKLDPDYGLEVEGALGEREPNESSTVCQIDAAYGI